MAVLGLSIPPNNGSHQREEVRMYIKPEKYVICHHGIYDASVCYYCSPPPKDIKEFADERHRREIESIIPYPSEVGNLAAYLLPASYDGSFDE